MIRLRQAKPFTISKRQVWEAYKRVKSNGGAAGVDGQTIDEFEKNLEGNLYKLWNRLASGSYMPSAVLRVEIPKSDGGIRPLGIPTVTDRIAQMVIKQHWEPELESLFHRDSYGYRPGKSAHEAVGVVRKRCWQNDWVLDLDIKGFFDNISHELMLKAVEKHTEDKWVLLYLERWLKAPIEQREGTQTFPDKGTPQGGVVSPLLANLFLHYAFDKWMESNFPGIPFVRYADDAVCNCKSEAQAEMLKQALIDRMTKVGLELHPEKTKIVYCQDDNRAHDYPCTGFDFLGFTFRARRSRNRHGKCFVNFSPAISKKAEQAIRQEIRGWKLHLRSDTSLETLAKMYNATIRGWINYYGRYSKSELRRTLRILDTRLTRWAMRKYKRLKGRWQKAMHWMSRIAENQQSMFVHWRSFGWNG